MSPAIDYTTALGRLLTDASLRRGFRADPAGTADAMGVTMTDRRRIIELCIEDLETQANTLISKRFHAVAAILPQTMMALGEASFASFVPYANGFWPRGHLKHFEDAVAFGRFLQTRGVHQLNALELNRVAFLVEQRRCALYWAPRAAVSGRLRHVLQLLFRKRGQVRQVLWFLALR